MTRYNRVGSCNRCGLCCGADRPRNVARRGPWPRNWPEAIRTWPDELIDRICPVLRALGLERLPDGTIGYDQAHGSLKVQGRTFYYVWVPGQGLLKDGAPHDGSNPIPECPALMDDPGDGTRPCGIYGTRFENKLPLWCRTDHAEVMSQAQVDEWIWKFGEGCTDGTYCSYSWEAIVD